LNDVATRTVTDENGESYSIEETILPDYRDSFKINGEYYALPHFSDYPAIPYDIDRFIEGGFYFADTTDADTSLEEVYDCEFGQATFVKANSPQAKKSVGNDGISGTEDDGLPTSAVEFLIMCHRMNKRGVKPMTLSGQYISYLFYFVEALWAGIGGPEEMKAVLTRNGSMEVVKVDANEDIIYTNEPLFAGYDAIKKPETETVTITEANGYKVYDSFARYIAVSMIEIMEKKGWFSNDTKNPSNSHIDAQTGFVCNGYNLTKVGMLTEGTYWYNEAKDNLVLQDYTELSQKQDKQMGFMSMPTSFDKSVTGENDARELAIFSSGYGGVYINKKFESQTGLINACKDFLAFCYTKPELIKRFASQVFIWAV